MVSHDLFSQLVLFALIGLVVILDLVWPEPGVSAPATPAEPAPPPTQAAPLSRAPTLRGAHPKASLRPV